MAAQFAKGLSGGMLPKHSAAESNCCAIVSAGPGGTWRIDTLGPVGGCRGGRGCGLCLLGDLLDHPPEEVRDLLFDPEPFELGGDLTAVVGRVIDNVAQDRPPRQ